MLFVRSHCYSDRDHALLSLHSWVSVVTGKMTAIDRTSKHVQVIGGRTVPYDHLILCTGQQYQVQGSHHIHTTIVLRYCLFVSGVEAV